MSGRLFVTLPGWITAAATLVLVVGGAASCNDPASIQQSVEARKTFVEKFNEVSSDGCKFESLGSNDMLRVMYTCEGLSTQEMVDRVALSCKTLGSYGVEEVRLQTSETKKSCLVSRSCVCEDIVKEGEVDEQPKADGDQ